MGRYLLTGDWHVKKGLQTDIILQYLDYLKNYYFDNDIDYIFVDGDIFHKSSNIKNEAFVPLFLKLMAMKEMGIKMIFIVGNHDITNVDNDSIVETFSSFGVVYKKGAKVELKGSNFYFQPYTKNESELPEASPDCYLITHLSIANFSFDNNFHATEKHAFKRELFKGWAQVFTGHFHRHQKWGNICYVGSPNQMYRSEVGQEKGFVVLDTDRENWEFIPYTTAPTFTEITENDIVNIKNKTFENQIVVVRLKTKVREYGKLRYILYEKGAIEVIPIFETENDEAEIAAATEISKSSSLPDTVRKAIQELEIKEGNDIDKEYLAKIFDKVLVES